jgi:hypothetical protein
MAIVREPRFRGAWHLVEFEPGTAKSRVIAVPADFPPVTRL